MIDQKYHFSLKMFKSSVDTNSSLRMDSNTIQSSKQSSLIREDYQKKGNFPVGYLQYTGTVSAYRAQELNFF